MTWFLDRAEAEALLATIDQRPGYTYTVTLNGCGPGYGVSIHDPDGVLLTESYSPGDIFPLRQPQAPVSEAEYHALLAKTTRERKDKE